MFESLTARHAVDLHADNIAPGLEVFVLVSVPEVRMIHHPFFVPKVIASS